MKSNARGSSSNKMEKAERGMCNLSEDEWILDIEESPTIDFFTASSIGLQDLVDHHLENGQNINEQNGGGWTALMYACAFHKNSIVSLLLSKGADITRVDCHGKTFLTVAAENQNLKALSSLNVIGLPPIHEDISKYCNKFDAVRRIINLQEYKYGYTPIMYSATQGDTEMAKVLLSLGADTTVKDFKGQTAEELAILNGHKTTCWVLQFYGEFSIRDVLYEIGLEKYSSLFANITSDELLLMDDTDLKELGMKLLGPRKKLALTIEKLKEIKKHIMNYEPFKTKQGSVYKTRGEKLLALILKPSIQSDVEFERGDELSPGAEE